jgi:hypothetical protein
MLSGTSRAIVVCPRCGICSDVPLDSAIENLVIDTPNLSVAGGELAVAITVRLNRAANLWVFPRLSTHHEKSQLPDPAYGFASSTRAEQVRLEFAFRLAKEISPHRHYVKLLAHTDDGLAFGSRPFFVRLPDSETTVDELRDLLQTPRSYTSFR